MHSHYILELYRYPSTPIWILPLRGNYPTTILLSSSSTFTSRRSLSASIVLQIISRISDAATLHFIVTASHPLARQFPPANRTLHCLHASSHRLTIAPGHYTVAYLHSTLIWAWPNLAGAALQYMTTGTLLCVQDLVVTRSKLMGFHMYQTCGDQPPQGCGGIQFVLANFTVVALLFFVHW
ncbi:hypothetical protein B0H14DRAFT_2944819 [Mycena olivaceomarginata]|nr:hypothetical protein B0H14DRAFT_2944819 [Mycena olivaceomarginata]